MQKNEVTIFPPRTWAKDDPERWGSRHRLVVVSLPSVAKGLNEPYVHTQSRNETEVGKLWEAAQQPSGSCKENRIPAPLRALDYRLDAFDGTQNAIPSIRPLRNQSTPVSISEKSKRICLLISAGSVTTPVDATCHAQSVTLVTHVG